MNLSAPENSCRADPRTDPDGDLNTADINPLSPHLATKVERGAEVEQNARGSSGWVIMYGSQAAGPPLAMPRPRQVAPKGSVRTG